MKKTFENIILCITTIIFALSPVILLVVYFTHTEKIVCPILLIFMFIAFIIAVKNRKEK